MRAPTLTCMGCSKQFEKAIRRNGKEIHNLRRRRFCLDCQPLGTFEPGSPRQAKPRSCLKCSGPMPPRKKVIDGVLRFLSGRLFCLKCSPFGLKNRRDLRIRKKTPAQIKKQQRESQLRWYQSNKDQVAEKHRKKYQEERAQLNRPIRSYKRSSEWVAIAEKLAAKNGGKLPNSQWLVDNGYWPLYKMMRRKPQLFQHLEQEVSLTGPVPLSMTKSQKSEIKRMLAGGLLPETIASCFRNPGQVKAYINEKR